MVQRCKHLLMTNYCSTTRFAKNITLYNTFINQLKFIIMATPTHEEIQDFDNEETEYTTQDEVLPEAYAKAVTEGNENDD